ncbi:polysaccharide lyase family 7 protein [Vibrio neonatus]|uniref:polysaccharide lyase family 7 protein n=1 Tax=Vibrio neonatus TaxID=278860 RepID=UPI0029056DA0|nr:polysaccharide lyase family 7 protein [Vibrio neonatus]
MSYKTKVRYITVAVAAALSLSVMSTANAASIDINNAGFENGFSHWSDTDPSAISGDAHSGKKSAKITGSHGMFQQQVTVQRNHNYELTAYIQGDGEVGVIVNGHHYSSTSSSHHDYKKVTVPFNSGSANKVTVFGAYHNDEGRFDDFSLTEVSTSTALQHSTQQPSQQKATPTSSQHAQHNAHSQQQQLLLIQSAMDDGSNDGHSPKNTIDGDTSGDSRWSSEGVGKSITYDLGQQEQVQKVAIKWFKGDSRSSYFHIDTSKDNHHWTPVLEGGMSSGDSSGYENVDVDDSNARYVRITGEGNSDSSEWNSIVETKIYGVETHAVSGPKQHVDNSIAASLLTPANTIKQASHNHAEQSHQSQQAQHASHSVAAGNAQYPSDLMGNYKQWKITFPTGAEQKQLYHVTNEYFHVNDQGNGIVFKAPIRHNNGTTPNTHNIRSELRERTVDGSSDIFWTTEGTHVVYSKQAITHLPIVKNELVATQIHGDKTAGIDDAMVMRLEGQHLFLSFNGGKLHHDVTIENNYKLGTEQEVIFKVVDGKHYVYYSEDGNLQQAYENGNADKYLVKDGANDYVMNRSYKDAYFKIGNYTQSNAKSEGDYTDNPKDYGEVVVYDFWASHE